MIDLHPDRSGFGCHFTAFRASAKDGASGGEIKIKDLVDLIVKLTDFKGKVIWDNSKPDGQPRRMMDIKRAEKEFDFKIKILFEEGLKKTIDWYNK